MVWVGRDLLKIIWFQPPCHEQRHLPPDQVAQSSIQPGLGHSQGGGSHSFSGQPDPAQAPSHAQPQPQPRCPPTCQNPGADTSKLHIKGSHIFNIKKKKKKFHIFSITKVIFQFEQKDQNSQQFI